MISNLEFSNRNLFRKFPLKESSTIVGDKLITGLSLTSKYGWHELYISSIYKRGGNISIGICDSLNNLTIGSFNVSITRDFQVAGIQPFYDFVSGNIVLGSKKDILEIEDGYYGYGYLEASIEESCIFCVATPVVTRLTNNGFELKGHIDLGLDNIKLALSGNTFDFFVVDNRNLFLNGYTGSCPDPIVSAINTVKPDSSHNIDVFGIYPVTVSVDADGITIDTVLEFRMDQLCVARNLNIPPTDISDSYYADVTSVEDPEWKTWPRFL